MEDYAAKMALKSDAALREYVAGHTQYREGAVLAALDELWPTLSAEQLLTVGEQALEVGKRGVHGQERLERTAPRQPGAGVRGKPVDAQLERQRTRVGHDDAPARRLPPVVRGLDASPRGDRRRSPR